MTGGEVEEVCEPGEAIGGPSGDGESARNKVNGGSCLNVSVSGNGRICSLIFLEDMESEILVILGTEIMPVSPLV